MGALATYMDSLLVCLLFQFFTVSSQSSLRSVTVPVLSRSCKCQNLGGEKEMMSPSEASRRLKIRSGAIVQLITRSKEE